VGETSLFEIETNATKSSLMNWNEYTVNEGDTIIISGNSTLLTNSPIYLEIDKRGLLSIEKISVLNNQIVYQLHIAKNFGPRFTLMIYSIDQSGKIYQYSQMINVNQNYNFSIKTDKEIYEPGDFVTLSITPDQETFQHSMSPLVLAVSFIDSAVLDVEPDDESELAFFDIPDYWTISTCSSSWGSEIGLYAFWWGYNIYRYNTGSYFASPSYNINEGDTGTYYALSQETAKSDSYTSLPSFNDILHDYNIEVRENISESANWIPKLVLRSATNLTFKLPDNIGEWTIRVVGTLDSWGKILTTSIKTLIPFFVEFEIPHF
jgi:hypothetical protein